MRSGCPVAQPRRLESKRYTRQRGKAMQFKPRPAAILLPFALLFLTACSDHLPSAPSESVSFARRGPAAVADLRMSNCPTRTDHQVSASIGERGGKLEIDGHSLDIPAGAVGSPTTFTLHAPAGQYLRVELTAHGMKHYEFETPVAVTISYERCRRQHRKSRIPSAWYLDDD